MPDCVHNSGGEATVGRTSSGSATFGGNWRKGGAALPGCHWCLLTPDTSLRTPVPRRLGTPDTRAPRQGATTRQPTSGSNQLLGCNPALLRMYQDPFQHFSTTNSRCRAGYNEVSSRGCSSPLTTSSRLILKSDFEEKKNLILTGTVPRSGFHR